MLPILIAYASKYGGTAGIAERIGTMLHADGFPVEVRRAEEIEDVAPYSAVIIGSGVYAGQWLKPVTHLLEQQSLILSQKPVWLFSSGPTGEGDASTLMKGYRYPDTMRQTIEAIQPRAIAFFHGVLNLEKLNFAERLIIRTVRAPVGDFRDWASINAWAQGIADALREKLPV